jgi:hypothetical protein
VQSCKTARYHDTGYGFPKEVNIPRVLAKQPAHMEFACRTPLTRRQTLGEKLFLNEQLITQSLPFSQEYLSLCQSLHELCLLRLGQSQVGPSQGRPYDNPRRSLVCKRQPSTRYYSFLDGNVLVSPQIARLLCT